MNNVNFNCCLYVYKNKCPGWEEHTKTVQPFILKENLLWLKTIIHLRIWIHKFLKNYYSPNGKGFKTTYKHFMNFT
jgi:hypothetical protein